MESILKKDRGYTPTTPGLDNTGYTSETEGRVSFLSLISNRVSNKYLHVFINRPGTDY